MKVLVCGGRAYANRFAVECALAPLNPSLVITGGCPTGADRYAMDWATEKRVNKLTFKADWASLGRKAGPIRNQAMVDHGKPHLVLAFPGGRGTADMVRRAKLAGIEVVEIDSDRRGPE